ncbi:hypothetical protein ACVFI8_19975 [Agarivorans sp. MS3-6]|uniref:hypothetical protein n=1 Tax=Agarivorans sp. TSD2052 TaxID=2937286 RepID=UPI00200DDD62|nr:hypothetical protein [Agarivorans sp. TSD2052]UPW16886.1 hypothetical protein M0C34_11575 [Agarivorans sp. TSD2052]
MIKNPNLFWWGVFTGVIGMLFYANFREPQILFDAIPAYQWIKLFETPIELPRYASEWFPSFLHVLGMSLFTAGLLGTEKKRWLTIPLFWLIVDLGFEFFQASTQFGVLSYGNFEWMDVAALFAATLVSCVLLRGHHAPISSKVNSTRFAAPLAVLVGSSMMLGSYENKSVDELSREICTYPDQSQAICAVEPLYLDWASFRANRHISFSAENANPLTQSYVDGGAAIQEFVGLEHSGKLYLHQDLMFVVSELRGVYVFDNSDSSTPAYLGFIHVTGASDVLIHKGMIVVAALTDLVMIDLNDLNNLVTDELALERPYYDNLIPQGTIFAQINEATEEYQAISLDHEYGLVIGYKNAEGKPFYFWALEDLL